MVRWDGGTGRTGVGAGAEADAVVKEIISWVADQAGGCVGESCVGVSVCRCRCVGGWTTVSSFLCEGEEEARRRDIGTERHRGAHTGAADVMAPPTARVFCTMPAKSELATGVGSASASSLVLGCERVGRRWGAPRHDPIWPQHRPDPAPRLAISPSMMRQHFY